MSEPAFQNRRQRGFTMIANEALRDKRLSWKAKGVLAAMRSYPGDWTFRQAHLETISSDGRDALRTAIRELEQYGYLTRHQERDPDTGRLTTAVYHVTDEPEPVDGFSVDGSPVDGSPVDGKPAATNTEGTKNQGTKNQTPSSSAEARATASAMDADEARRAEWERDRAKRQPPRHSDKINALRLRHPRAYEALGRLSTDRGWKPNQFTAVAVSILGFADRYGEPDTRAALEDVLIAGDQIVHPVRWIERKLTSEDTPAGTGTSKPAPARRNIIDELGVDL